MPEINNIFIDDPKRLREPIKSLEVRDSSRAINSLEEDLKRMTKILNLIEFRLELISSLSHMKKILYSDINRFCIHFRINGNWYRLSYKSKVL